MKILRVCARLALAAALLAATACAAGHEHSGGCCGSGPQSPPPATQPPGSSQSYVYKCPMDGATRATPGPCPRCGMPLGEGHRVPQ